MAALTTAPRWRFPCACRAPATTTFHAISSLYDAKAQIGTPEERSYADAVHGLSSRPPESRPVASLSVTPWRYGRKRRRAPFSVHCWLGQRCTRCTLDRRKCAAGRIGGLPRARRPLVRVPNGRVTTGIGAQGAPRATSARNGRCLASEYDVGRAPVAQWIERGRPKACVGGSNPSGGATPHATRLGRRRRRRRRAVQVPRERF